MEPSINDTIYIVRDVYCALNKIRAFDIINTSRRWATFQLRAGRFMLTIFFISPAYAGLWKRSPVCRRIS
jgi:hypothetical protein